MQTLVGVVVGGLIGGVFALAGVFLGPLIKARQDEVQWRREKRLDAYAEQYRAVLELLLTAYKYEEGSPEAAALLRAMHDVVSAESRVRLLAPKGVREASQKLGERMSDVVTFLLDGGEPSDASIDELRALHEAFAEAARRDLGVRE